MGIRNAESRDYRNFDAKSKSAEFGFRVSGVETVEIDGDAIGDEAPGFTEERRFIRRC